MLRETLLAGAVALPMLLAGCSSLPPMDASPEKPFVYDPEVSHALNVNRLFNLEGRYRYDGTTPIDVTKISEEPVAGSPRPAPVIGTHFTEGLTNLGSGSLSGMLIGFTVGVGLDFTTALVTSIVPISSDEGHNIVGFVPERNAPTADEARDWIIGRVTEALERAARDLCPEAEIQVLEDNAYLGDEHARKIVVRMESAGCTEEDDCFARISSNLPEYATEHAGDLTPYERSWVFGPDDTELFIRDQLGHEKRVDWALIAMRSAEYLPPYVYLDLRLHGGSAALEFIVEKGRLNFYVDPSVQPTLPPARTAADGPVNDTGAK
ncbi:hypothetical protein [Sutterella sp.]|uniref:hypothetical protein n=1 Tax=Sutterella sp. TaxID=1981025 RepID=UPI0026DEC3F2|nr:hypothetical protein [Sutterella sp.]MDO5532599.1 hypothetical protein [Sutterella sp.]